MPSVQPLYTDEDRVQESRLSGSWNTGDVSMEIVEDGFWYDVTMRSSPKNRDESVKIRARLVELHGALWVDLFPVVASDAACVSCVTTHMLAKLAIDEDALRLSVRDSEWLEVRAKQEHLPAASSRDSVTDAALILFADTNKLREFIGMVSDEPAAFLKTDSQGEIAWARNQP